MGKFSSRFKEGAWVHIKPNVPPPTDCDGKIFRVDFDGNGDPSYRILVKGQTNSGRLDGTWPYGEDELEESFRSIIKAAIEE